MGMIDDIGMKIGENKYKIEADNLNITLYQYMEKKDKTHYWYPVAYFGTPQNALEYLMDKEIMETGFKDFETVCKKQDELYQLIQALPDNILSQLVKRDNQKEVME